MSTSAPYVRRGSGHGKEIMSRYGQDSWAKQHWVFLATVIATIFMFGVMIASLRSAEPSAGHEVVLVMKPMLFGHGGVWSEPVKTGQTYVAWTTDRIDVDMQPMQFGEHFDDLMSSDGVPLDFDSVIRTRVTDSVKIVERFGPDWYKRNMQAEFRNRVRQAVRKHGMNETAIDTHAIDKIDAEVSTSLEEYIQKIDLPVKLIDVTIGKANPPDSIKNQRVETAAQQQRILTEAQRKLAEDARAQAEQSRAVADNAYRNAMQMNPTQFIELERLKMQKEVCAKGGCTFLIGQVGAVPVLRDAPAEPKK